MADLRDIARETMLAEGFQMELSPEARAELAELGAGVRPPDDGVEPVDMRTLPWSSVDDADSLDLDQLELVERAEGDSLRLRIAVADVDALVRRGSALDRHAAASTTSVYTGVDTFPMLPDLLSTDLTSLSEGVDRLAVVISMTVAPDGGLGDAEFQRAWVRNHARLAYDTLDLWMLGGPRPPRVVTVVPGMQEQMMLQREAARRLRARRAEHGALALETVEARPVAVGGRVVELRLVPDSAARELIESFMTAANMAMARHLEHAGVPALRRVVEKPRGWPRLRELVANSGGELPPEPDVRALARFLDARRAADPERYPDLSLSVVKLLGAGMYAVDAPGNRAAGHFGLAVDDYTHSTAPNRRFADLVVQRQLKALLAGSPPPYGVAELEEIASHCNERSSDARRVERQLRKDAAAALMAPRLGQDFDAIVTGVKSTATYVRLLHPPVEGRVVRGEEGLQVGDTVRVRLLSTDQSVGHLDFAADV